MSASNSVRTRRTRRPSTRSTARGHILSDVARSTIERLEQRQLLTAVIQTPDPVIPWAPTRTPQPVMAGHSFYVSGIDMVDATPANGQWDNASAVTPNTTNDLVLNQAPSDTNYIPCCEAGNMNNISVFTDGSTQNANSGSPDDASAPGDIIADLGNGPWHATYTLGGATPNANGYDISEIDVISGHQDYRTAMPNFDVLVEPVGSNTFYSLSGSHFSFTQVPDGKGGSITLVKGSAQAAIVNSSGGPVATNIAKVEFLDSSNDTFWREFVVTGTPSANPISTGTPAAPTLSAALTPGQVQGVTLTITNNANNQQGFLIERSTDGTNYTQIGSLYSVDAQGKQITFQDTAPVVSGMVFYRVRAFNGSNNSAYSNVASVTIAATNGWEAQYYMSDQANQNVWDGDQVAGATLTQPDGTAAGNLTHAPPATPPTNNAVLGFERFEPNNINYTNFGDANPPPNAPAGWNTIQPAGPGHQFAARWTGYVTPTVTGYYTLMPRSDDGGSVTVFDTTNLTNGKPTPVTLQPDSIFWLRGPTTDNDPVTDVNGNPVQWVAGQKYLVQMDYNNSGGGWEADLSWAASSTVANEQATPPVFDALAPQLIPVTDVTAPVPTFQTIDAANPNGLAKDNSFYVLIDAPVTNGHQLTWNNIDATSYNIYRSTTPIASTNPAMWGTKIASVPANQGGTVVYTDTTAASASTYYYLVTGVNSSGEGNGLKSINVLPAPTNLTATQVPNTKNTGVVLSWTNNALGEQSFDIERSSDGGATFTTIATLPSTAAQGATVTYTDWSSGLALNGASYQYKVRAQAFGLNSAFSNTASITTTAAPAINFEPDFSGGISTMTVNSNGANGFTPAVTAATDTPPNALELLDNAAGGGEAEAVWTNNRYNVSNFDTTFQFQWGGAEGADGITFAINNDNPNQLGGGGGSMGWAGIPNSVAVNFNLYPSVSETGIAVAPQATKNAQIDLTTENGNPTGIDFHANANDVYQVHLVYDGTTLHETVTDVTNGTGMFTHDYTVNIPAAIGASSGFLGFTAGDGGAVTNAWILNWKYSTMAAGNVTLSSVAITDGSTNTNQTQRSEVREIALTFSGPVTLGTGAVTLAQLNTGGSGKNDGSGPTDASAALGTPTSPDGGTTWIIPIAKSTAFSDATGSLVDGIYTVTVDPTKVTGGTLTGTNLSTTFHRLFGDITGGKTVNNGDYLKFKQAYLTSTGNPKFNADFDYDANGTINNADFLQFKKRYLKVFTY